MKIVRSAFLVSVLCAVLASCSHDGPSSPAGAGTAPVTPVTPVTPVNPPDTPHVNPADTALCFERDILPIFISNCAKSGCHDAASHEDGYVFTSYATITHKKFEAGDLDETELWEKINEHDEDDIMPPPPNAPLTDAQKARIKQWILMGAPNSGNCSAGTGCDSVNVTFAGRIQPLLNNYCVGCHSAASPSGGITLSNHAGVAAVAASGRLYGAITHAAGYVPMPQGGAQLSSCNITAVRKWIEAGMLNN